MYGLALCFGYPPDEFWPVQYGALGRSGETEIHHLRGSHKGGSDFVLGFQEKIQTELPPTLLFRMDARDTKTEMNEAVVFGEWAKVASSLYENGQGVLDRDEVRQLLAEKGLINPDWTESEEESSYSSSGVKRQQEEEILSNPQIIRAINQQPYQPIVRFDHTPGQTDKFTVLRDRDWETPELL